MEKEIDDLMPLDKKEMTFETLAEIALGQRPGVPPYQIINPVEKYPINRSDPNMVAHELATGIMSGQHSWDMLHLVKYIIPDHTPEQLKQLQLEILIKAAGITATEKLSYPQGDI